MDTAPPFIHLRLHSEYSLSDGIVQIPALIDKAKEYQMPALALTDQSNVFAIVKFYKAAMQAGIKPILGADLWLENVTKPQHPFRFTVFCKHNQGYKNLLALISQSFLQGQAYNKAIIKYDWLKQFADGLIVLSGAEEGDLGQALLKNDQDQVKKLLSFWKQYFPNHYYLELRRTGFSQQENYIQAALQITSAHSLPVIATNDVRFLAPEDFDAHEARVCIHEGWMLADPKRPHPYREQQYFRSQDEMLTLFTDIPESLTNTVLLAKRCNVNLTLGKSFLPRFPVPEGFTTESYLSDVAAKGLEERLKIILDSQSPAYAIERRVYDTRLQTELSVINSMGFAGYFLIVADFTRWARENGVPVGPGRGSGPGSLVSYAIKITDLDPIKLDLLFERFLNPERVSLPDFDIDFCMEGRDRVIDYVMQTHGKEAVAQIITYGTMAARAVVRDVGRVLGMSYGHVDKLAKLIPFELGMTLDKALEQEILLRERYEEEEEVKTLFDLAHKLEGITRNAGKHAGGVVIAPSKLTEFTALYCEAETPEHIVTQFDKDDVEAVGLVKFDFLGLRTLTIIDWALKKIHQNEPNIDIHFIPMNDTKTFALLKECKTTAVFQLESRGMKDIVKRLKPDCFDDLMALVALFRPGPLQSGMVEDFINRKHGLARVQYPHPQLEPILRSTYGVILYQEQVMQIAQVLAGYSLGSADLLRRAMGKKKPEEMAMHRETFCKGAAERGVKSEVASSIFDLMEKFAGYGFNKPHAASYALIAYQTAWLKAHYPAAYMAAVLSADMDHTEKVVHFIEECAALGLTILPPDINRSEYTFKVLDENQIAYGLGAIKGAGQSAMESLVESRSKEGDFKNLFDFCQRIDLKKFNRRVLEALIKAGAFDTLNPHRASLLATLNHALLHAEQMLRDKTRGQRNLLDDFESTTTDLSYVEVPAFSEQERLQGEKETLGLYLTGHPIHRYLPELKNFMSARIAELYPKSGEISTIAGIIINIRTIQTKRGDRMAVVSIDDQSAIIDILCFSENYQKFREYLIKDNLIIVQGEVSHDEFTGGHRMISQEIFSIVEARERFAKYLQIHLNAEQTHLLPELANVLTKFRGTHCRVTIDYLKASAKASLHLGNHWRIKPTDDLLKILKEQFAGMQVDVVY